MKTVKKRHRGSIRLFSLFMALMLCFSCLSGLPVAVAAEDETTTVSTWTQIDLADVTSSDKIAITMTISNGTVYALPTANTGSKTAPTAVIVTATDDNTLSIEATGDDYGWTFTSDEEVEGGYIITSPSGDYLYTTDANNGVRVHTTKMTWTLDGNYLYSSTNGRWLGVYTTNPDWRAYTNTTGNTAGQTVGFWKYSGETTESGGSTTDPAEDVETPSLTYSETDKTVTFKCATSGVTYYYSYSESGDYTALDGSSLDVSGHIGETLYAYAELDGSMSETTSVELTETSTEPTVSGYELLTGDIASGDQVMIYYSNGGTAITGTASGSRLTGGDVSVADGVMETNNVGEVFTVYVDDSGYLSFVTDEGAYLTCGSTGNSLTLESASSDYSLWTLENAGESGSYYIRSVNASYNGSAQYIEYYSGFTTYGFNSSNAALYTYQLYYVGHTDAEQPSTGTGDEEEGDDSTLTSGTYVVWNPAYGYALSSSTNSSGYYVGVSVTESASGKVSGYGDTELWVVTVSEDGTLTLEQNGSYMGMNSSNYLTFGEADALDHYTWIVEDAEDGLYYLKDPTSSKYVEWYSNYSDWSTYYSIASGNEGMFALKFSPVSEDDYTVDTSMVEDIAQWGGGGPYTDDNASSINGDKYTVGDMLDTDALFTVVAKGVSAQPYQTTTSGTGGTNYYMGGTSIGASEGDYMQFAVSTAGWGDMELSFRMRATNAAPGSFQLQYSTDGGETFTSFTTGTYSYAYTQYTSDSSYTVSGDGSITDGIAKTSLAAAQYVTFTFDVPEGAENADNLLIRLVAGTARADGGSGSISGNIRIDSVVLSGSPIVDDSITGYVSVSPDNSEDQAVGTELTLTSSTEGATIYYRFVNTTTGNGEWLTYDESSKPTLDDLPATVEVYATSDGRATSVTRILTYAAGTVSSVKFSPNGGGVYIEDKSVAVTLTSATEGATIYYAITYDTDEDGNYVFATDSDSGEIIYTEYVLNEDGSSPISLSKGFGGASIMAYAELEGYTTSAVTTRTFTERSQEAYNIYFGQLHSHTNYSDGAGSITDAYEHATEVHETTDTLDFLAVTDHSNSFDSASSDSVTISDGSLSEEWTEGKAYAEQYTTDEFVALFGYEMTWSNGLGHINTYNTGGFQSRTQSAYTTYSTALQNYYETLKTVTDSISQFNHPGTTFGDFQDFSYFDEEIDELITLIEVGNGEGTNRFFQLFPVL